MYIWHIHMIDYMIITVPTIPPSLVFKILHCWFNLFFEGVNHHFPWCSIFVPGISHSCPLSFHSIRWKPAFQWFLVGPTRLLPQDGRHSWRSQAHHKCVYSIYIYIHTHTISYNHTIIMWPTLLLICFSAYIYTHLHTMIRINDSRFLQLLLHTYIYIYIISRVVILIIIILKQGLIIRPCAIIRIISDWSIFSWLMRNTVDTPRNLPQSKRWWDVSERVCIFPSSRVTFLNDLWCIEYQPCIWITHPTPPNTPQHSPTYVAILECPSTQEFELTRHKEWFLVLDS